MGLKSGYLQGCIPFKSLGFLDFSVHFSSVTQSCPTLCDPMDCSTPGFPFHHQLLEPTQTHVHQVGVIAEYFPLIAMSF